MPSLHYLIANRKFAFYLSENELGKKCSLHRFNVKSVFSSFFKNCVYILSDNEKLSPHIWFRI
jgi:hypothetical protein